MDALKLILTLGLVVVGAFGVRYVKKTLKDVRTQAEAANKLANHLVTADRAWVVEKIDFPKELPFQQTDIPDQLFTTFVVFEINNVGKTLARIKNIRLRFHTVGKLNDLSPQPEYSNLPRLEELGENGFPLIPGNPVKCAAHLEGSLSLSQGQAEVINAGTLFLCAYASSSMSPSAKIT